MRGEEEISNSEGAVFEKQKLRRLLAKSRTVETTIWVGKDGVSDALLSQIDNQLKIRELIKLKTQRSALQVAPTSELAKKIAASTASALVEVMGHTFTLYRKRENRDVQKNSTRKQRLR